MLRVIAGFHRTRKLEQPNIKVTRATTDRVRETIFNMLFEKVKGAITLDVFAGSGAMSIESISRGAMKSFINDSNAIAKKVIEKNIESLKIDNAVISQFDFKIFLRSRKGTKYDLIFLDPPYEKEDMYKESIDLILKNKLLNTNGIIIIEANTSLNLEIPKGFVIQKEKKLGKTKVVFVANNN